MFVSECWTSGSISTLVMLAGELLKSTSKAGASSIGHRFVFAARRACKRCLYRRPVAPSTRCVRSSTCNLTTTSYSRLLGRWRPFAIAVLTRYWFSRGNRARRNLLSRQCYERWWTPTWHRYAHCPERIETFSLPRATVMCSLSITYRVFRPGYPTRCAASRLVGGSPSANSTPIRMRYSLKRHGPSF